LNTGTLLQTMVSLIQALSLVLVLYLLVKPKWQFFE
jgi:flagellar biogenesis protein FliO